MRAPPLCGPMDAVRQARNVKEWLRCFPVLRQLRPHLKEKAFLERLRTQTREGYRLAFVDHDGAVAAVAGFRIQNMLHQATTGRMMYVDDLVTAETRRSAGHGAQLLQWLAREARRQRCDALELDSGVQRVGAHRFYLGQGMHISSYHFRLPLRAAAPRVLSFGAMAEVAKPRA